MKAKAIAVFGSASDVGKSVITTALCRIFSNLGIKTAPFKAQNMSNNSFVTPNNGEIGRAQAVQAFACNIEPTTDMNPVLLKPSSDKTSQVILRGKAIGNTDAKSYFTYTDYMFREALKSLNKILNEFELVVIEGAGSCAEVNLRNKDFANFKTAKAANANVILVADIDKGGVFAQILGTLKCLEKQERKMVKGVIINKFRGDKRLFKDGIAFIESKTQVPVIGVIPYFHNIEIENEDGISPDFLTDKTYPIKDMINIAVLKLPHISNFTDFSPFGLEERIKIHYLSKPVSLSGYDALLIPGSKSVIQDLKWIKNVGWQKHIEYYRKNGGYIFGICGGYQMLGKSIKDPFLTESSEFSGEGLGFLDSRTTLKKTKTVANIKGIWLKQGINIEGYEIHTGKTITKELPAIKITYRNGKPVNDYDGISRKNIAGCYIHGIFENHKFRHYFLNKIAKDKFNNPNNTDYKDFRQLQYDLLADHIKRNINMKQLMEIAGF